MDANEDTPSRKDRKVHNTLFRAIQNGDFDLDDYEEFASQPARMFLVLFRLSTSLVMTRHVF